MAKRYRIYSVKRRNDRIASHYISGSRTSHHWADKEATDTYTALQAVKKMEHVTGVVRRGGNSKLTFAIEVVE